MTGADLMFAPMVAMMRLPLLSAEARNPSALPTETIRAGAEKVAAVVEGVAAAQMAYAGAMMSFWPEVMTGKKPALLSKSLAEKALTAALKPASVRVKANYRRLSRS
ncbi:MAG: hypothetical protein M9924_14250 [Rhizobiaceae bacterium]|nr:hypothetical protein [Rhizobiaceae bacterium]